MSGTLEQARRLSVFLCHSSGDKEAVRGLYRRLLADGIDPWLDEEKLLPGHHWHNEITSAVRKADAVIVCLSNGSVNKEGYIQKEIKFALDIADEKLEDTIFIIPLKLEECEVPKQLNRWHWVNLYEKKGYIKLLDALLHRANAIGLNIKSTVSSVLNDINLEFSWMNQWAEERVRGGRGAARDHNYKKAEELFNRVLGKFPDYPSALSGLANVCFHQRRFQEGLDYANRAIRIDPNFPYPYYQRAICLKSMGNLDDAEMDFERALRLKPDFEYARQALKRLRMLKTTDI